MEQENLIKLSLMEQKTKEIEERISLIEQNINELQNISLSLDKFEEHKEKEILSQIGRGIFVKSELKNKELIVDVGSKILVKKTSDDVREIINEQIRKLTQARIENFSTLEMLSSEMQEIIKKVQS